MIEKVDSVTISFLVIDRRDREQQRAEHHQQRDRLERLVAGPQDDEHADEADRERAARGAVMRSPRNSTASSVTQAGMMNSSANTVANGSIVIAIVQQICDPKCTTLRATCSRMRCARRPSSKLRPASREQGAG